MVTRCWRESIGSGSGETEIAVQPANALWPPLPTYLTSFQVRERVSESQRTAARLQEPEAFRMKSRVNGSSASFRQAAGTQRLA